MLRSTHSSLRAPIALPSMYAGLVLAGALLTGCAGAARPSAVWVTSSALPLRGVNVAGAEFGERELPGTYGTSYIYPSLDDVQHFLDAGMTTLRLPFRWERLQQALYGALDRSELRRLDAFVATATGEGAFVVLDPHNFARFHDGVIGSEEVPAAAFADFWRRLAVRYRSNGRVIFGLMNEPRDMPTEQWVEAANAAIAAIRSTGARNLVLVPGNGWSGAHAWHEPWYGTPNAEAMLRIHDPGGNTAIEVHQYLDAESAGVEPECVDPTVGSRRMERFTAWLRAHGHRAFLGELGAPATPTCLEALRDLLGYVHANADVYLGWAYWAAGPWWGDYMLSIEPREGVERPQMTVLRGFLGPTDATATDETPAEARRTK